MLVRAAVDFHDEVVFWISKMDKIEINARRKYNENSTYCASAVSDSLFETSRTFSSRIMAEKRRVLLPWLAGKRVLDLGCGNGRHLADLASRIKFGVGVDFSVPFIQYAREHNGADNLRFVLADARKIPLASGVFDCAYSFSTMYNIDDVGDVYAELKRVLVLKGIAILELGNSLSLSTLVSRQYPDWAHHSARTISEHRLALCENGFEIMEWRSFQLLPMWGDKPWWLRPLRNTGLERLFMSQIGEHMIDEWVSSLPIVRCIAFRHLVVCAKR